MPVSISVIFSFYNEEEVLEEGLAGTAAMAFFAAMTAKGLEPEITIDEGLEITIEWIKSNRSYYSDTYTL